MTTFSCQACGSPSFAVRGALAPTAEVCCASCGAALGNWEAVLRVSVDLLQRLGAQHRRLDADGPTLRPRVEAAASDRTMESGAVQDPR
jgi:uncharacterized Zn finger protein (UPF0148 family)